MASGQTSHTVGIAGLQAAQHQLRQLVGVPRSLQDTRPQRATILACAVAPQSTARAAKEHRGASCTLSCYMTWVCIQGHTSLVVLHVCAL